MSNFDPEKDKEIWSDTFPNGNSNLELSLHSYDGKSPKLQIGPRWYLSKDGGMKPGKAGRLSEGEIRWLKDTLEDLIEEHFGG